LLLTFKDLGALVKITIYQQDEEFIVLMSSGSILLGTYKPANNVVCFAIFRCHSTEQVQIVKSFPCGSSFLELAE